MSPAPIKRPRAEEILGEWGVRDVAPPSQAERERLERDLEIDTLVGKPLRRRLRLFRTEGDNYLASLGGPLPYMRRLKQIEEDTADHKRRLEALYAERGSDPVAWREIVERWDFGTVNDLIDRHNRFYPIEAHLPMNPRSRDFVEIGGQPYQRGLLDASWILTRFPA
ncbi:MAG: hypothetical protein WCH31_06960 [Actinomycetes bacterium]